MMEGVTEIEGKEDQRDYDIYMLRQKMSQLELFIPQLLKLIEEQRKDFLTIHSKISEIEAKIREIAAKVR
jgi:archaellum component FlaC